jgi:cytochrome c biogenesis protein CcmG, thiol:disulfide interchange protein DsbE
MKRRPALFLLLAIALFAWPRDSAADTASFRLRALSGETVELADLCAKGPVLLSYWATFCEPCKQEIPHLIELVKRFDGQHLQLALITVDSPRSQKQVKPYVSSKGWTMPVLMDPNGQTMKKMKGTNPPYTVLVGRGGEVLYTHSGYKPGDEKALEKELGRLLNAPAAGAGH